MGSEHSTQCVQKMVNIQTQNIHYSAENILKSQGHTIGIVQCSVYKW